MSKSRSLHWLLPLLLLAAVTGCWRTKLVGDVQSRAALPRPSRVLVYDFATSPSDVKLGSGLAAHLIRAVEKETPTTAEARVGQAVADALSEKLVKELRSLGLPAERASGTQPAPEGSLEVHGYFLSIDEGNRRRRILIGLGAGASEVKTFVQVYETLAGGRRPVDQFEIDAKSGRKPGMAETMGVGALAGDAAIAAGVGVAGAVASESFGADVKADASRTAAKIAEALSAFFRRQGWLD